MRIKFIWSLLSCLLLSICVSAQSQYVISGEVTYSGVVHGHSNITINSEYVIADWDDDGTKHHKSFKYSTYQCNPSAEAIKIVSSANKEDWLICFNGSLTFTCGSEHHLSVFPKNDRAFLNLLTNANNMTGIFASYGYNSTPQFVDLGLSVKWATCNVGASKPEEHGDYFAWGETSTKNGYSWTSMKYQLSGAWDNVRFSKYVTDSKFGSIDNSTNLDNNDDVAYVKSHGNSRMPTINEFEELINKCTWLWTSINGKNGYRVTSNINGKSIFLPVTGSRFGDTIGEESSCGYYWSSSLDIDSPNYARNLFFNNSGKIIGNKLYRFAGNAVRPVCQ